MKTDLIGNCQTTAMGILPHTSMDKAMQLAFSLDIPFWPQLPKMSFYEDMYVQASEHMPGIIIDVDKKLISFSKDKFYEELPEYAEHMEDLAYFRLSPRYSLVYDAFLKQDLLQHYAIRGQFIGPVSYGLKITDENKKPIIYDDEVRQFLYEFMSQKIKAQYLELEQYNERAFIWTDEPGLGMIFMAITGYSSELAQKDYAEFLKTFPGPKGVHLCANPDWSFLLNLDLDILSLDVLAWGEVFQYYTEEIKGFLDRGGIISWGITPTLEEQLDGATVSELLAKLEGFWDFLASRNIPKEQILAQAWLAPARCCLVNPDESGVEKSFEMIREMSQQLREKYKLY
ncbi:MAG: hypothetical protein PHX16_00305 [Syntrophaceticus sp.]|nr:hypothetical protein [Syntrophaceticus sp.]MDD3314942.1 hypothetical protein [Syntrophaceticus sp.]MDD4359170.1 hypothetical protein [Syntrophaceticus sp.]MDD4782076.1 hypothetical protein [Syntrophaceticus sp.]